ncbi:MAG: serine/threonine protein kinase [Myxococcales bacterium]|nr:serine/threonine protein kinase [Myxococcales bacterium]
MASSADRDEGNDADDAASVLGCRPQVHDDFADALGRAQVRHALFGDPIVPPRIGRYEVLSLLGRGAMGSVFLAHDPRLGRHVAIKLVGARSSDDQGARRARLLEEARALARLSHPNVVAIHDVDLADGQVYLVMEHIEGESLLDWLDELHRDDRWRAGKRVQQVLRLFVEAGRGLEAAHRAGLVHRDFKPANVIIGRDGRARVLDFGLAATVGDDGWGGTPAYMAPEQRAGGAVEARADVWAFCVALYEALEGTRPAAAGPLRSTVRISRSLCNVLARGLVADPDERAQGMGGILRDLARTRGRRAPIIVAAIVAGGVGVAAGLTAPVHGESRCSPTAPPLADVWNDARRQDVERAFAAVDHVAADSELTRSLVRIDQYVERWEAERLAACEAARVRFELSEAGFERRMTCLRNHAIALAGLVDVMSEIDADGVLRATAAIDHLDPPAECEDVPSPPDPTAASELARARALVDLAANEDAERALTAGAIDRDPTLAAEFHLLHAQLLRRRGELDWADDHLAFALAAARRVDDRDAELQAWTAMLVRAIERGDPGVARIAEVASAVADGDGTARSSRIQLAMTLGNADLDPRPAQALGHYERALDLATPLDGDDDGGIGIARAKAMISRGMAAGALGHLDDALEWESRGHALLVEWRGPAHPEVGASLTNLGVIHRRMHRPREALALLDEAATLLEPLARWAPRELGALAQNRGATLLDLDRPEEAATAFTRALDVLEGLHGPNNAMLAYPLTGLGQAEIMRGRREHARAPLQRALELRSAGPTDPNELATTLYWLAQAVEPSDRDAGLELAHRAVATYDVSMAGAEGLDEVRAWIATIDGSSVRR